MGVAHVVDTAKEITMIKEIKQFLATNEAFREYVAKNMDTYNRSLNDELTSPITQEYYRSLQPDGCNYKGGKTDDV